MQLQLGAIIRVAMKGFAQKQPTNWTLWHKRITECHSFFSSSQDSISHIFYCLARYPVRYDGSGSCLLDELPCVARGRARLFPPSLDPIKAGCVGDGLRWVGAVQLHKLCSQPLRCVCRQPWWMPVRVTMSQKKVQCQPLAKRLMRCFCSMLELASRRCLFGGQGIRSHYFPNHRRRKRIALQRTTVLCSLHLEGKRDSTEHLNWKGRKKGKGEGHHVSGSFFLLSCWVCKRNYFLPCHDTTFVSSDATCSWRFLLCICIA